MIKKNIRRLLCSKQSGMSLLEIMLVIAIVAAILVGVIQLARVVNDRMKVENTKTALRSIKAGIDQYKVDIGKYPSKIEEIAVPPADSNDRRRWQGPYVQADLIRDGTIKDTYGNEIQYRYDQSANTFEVFSWGKNGQGADVGNIFID